MSVYIILLITVIILSRIIEKKADKKTGKVVAFILLLILSLAAGARSLNVGWDASKYVKSTFFRLDYFDGDYLKFMASTTVEFGFSLYSYLIYHIFPNVHALLFGYSFLTSLCVFIFAFKEREKLKLSSVIIIYYLTLYLISYNIIRQSISVALVLLSIPYLKEKKYFKCLILTVLSILFHKSAILALAIYFIYSYLKGKKTVNAKMTSIILITVVLIITTFIYPQIAKILYRIGIIPLKYYNYIIGNNRLDYNFSNIIINLYWVLIGLLSIKSKNNQDDKNGIAFCLLLLNISLVINIISIRTHEIYRIGYYFYYIGLLYFYPVFPKIFNNNKFNKNIINLATTAILVFWFLWITILGNGHNIYPYQSDIRELGIKETSWKK